MTRKIFITGGLGYIGSALAKQAVEKGYSILLFDSLIYGQNHPKLLRDIGLNKSRGSKHHLVIGDIRNTELLKHHLQTFKPDFLFHFAEISGIWAANHNPILTREISYEASKQVLDLAEGLKIPTIYNSSSSLYGNQKNTDLLEESARLPLPTDEYCKNKLLMEKYIKSKVSKNPSFKIIVLRPATICGVAPRMRLELLPVHFTYCAISKGQIKISDPHAYRAAIDVRDMVRAYFSIMDTKKWPCLTYNIGNYNVTKQQVGEAIQKIIPCKLGLMKDIGDPRNLQISSKRFAADFNWKPSYRIEETLKETKKWLEKNRARIEKDNFAGVLNIPSEIWIKLTS